MLILLPFLLSVVNVGPIEVAKVGNEWVITETRRVDATYTGTDVKIIQCFELITFPGVGVVQGATPVNVFKLKGNTYGVTVTKPGTYRLITIDSKFNYTTEDFTVGSPGPTPPPTPIPTPTPTPGPRNVIIIHETADLTPQRSKLLMDIRVKKYPDTTVWIVDPDTKDSTGQTPAWLKGWLDQTTKFPTLIISDKNGNKLHQSDLPPNEQEFENILKGTIQ